MDANEDYLDSLLNSVMSQDLGGADGGSGNAQQNNGGEAEIKEINDVLKKSENQMPHAEMLAMLERAESGAEERASDNDVPDVFDIFSSESVELEEDYAAGESVTDGAQKGADSEAYLDALLNGTASDDLTDGNGQMESGAASPDGLQSGEDLLSLDSLQSEEKPPMEGLSGEEDFLSLDSLQSEEEPPMEGLSGEEDFLSLDSLQSEEEPPMEVLSSGEDFLSLDSLQGEEEMPSLGGSQKVDDLFSLDSLQSDAEMSFDGLSEEEDMGYESSMEEDDEIQKEIDELLGLAGTHDAEDSVRNDDVPTSSISNAANDKEEALNKEEKKEKKEKKKKRFGKKKEKEAAGVSRNEEQGNEPTGMEAGDWDDGTVHVSGDVADDEMTIKDASSSAQTAGTSDGKKRKSKGKKEKVKKQNDTVNAEEGQKEPGFFAKMFNALFEEADEDEDTQPQEMEVSDENREIMEMMANEKIENKKPGSKKAKKGKKSKAGAKQEGEGEDDEEAPVDEKKAKKEKKKKEKKAQKEKAKQEKEQEEKAVPTKKLPKGKVFSIFAFCLTLLAVIVILCIVIPQQRDLKTARDAYYNRDYLTVYQNMDGKDLNDSDYILYMRSKMILNMQGKLDNYLVYMGMDKEMAALNELMFAVDYYQSNRSVAESYGALDEMNTVYAQVLSVLSQQYHLSETEAIEIFALDDLSYNERLYYLVHGTAFVAPDIPQTGLLNSTGTTGGGNDSMNDMLPEENEMFGDDPQQSSGNDMPANDFDTGAIAPSDDWGNGYNENPSGVTGTEDFGTNMSAGRPSDVDGEDAPFGADGENLPAGANEGSQSANEGDGNQPQNRPGESLSQGNGDELYSGEVKNGNVVLQ